MVDEKKDSLSDTIDAMTAEDMKKLLLAMPERLVELQIRSIAFETSKAS